MGTYSIEAVGDSADTIKENRKLIKRLTSKEKSISEGYPPIGTKHIGNEFKEGHYYQVFYSKIRDEYFSNRI